MSWNIQLVISDLTKTKRRIILSSTTNKIEIKPFFVKIPCLNIKQGIWNTFAVDLFSYIEVFKGQTYRSLDSIYITGHFKLRRIYTSNTRPIEDQQINQYNEKSEISFLPKNFYYPPQIQYTTKLISYETDILQLENLYQPTQPSTKNNSNIIKKKQKKLSAPKTNVIKSQKFVKETKQNVINQEKQKKFLANTNGPQMINRNKNFDRQDSSQQSQTEKSLKTPGNIQKGIKKKSLIKTQIHQKMKSSIEKKKQDKTKTKAKLNPWRTSIKDVQTDGSQLQISSKYQQKNERKVQSAQTTLFKTKNNLTNKFNQSKNRGFDRKSDHYSDSQYVQLSQKFSTLTDGKFFKNQLGNNFIDDRNQHNDQIEQNIQMETNSMYSSKKEQSPNRLHNQQIVQSICDSLEKKQSPIKISKNEFDFRNSHYGFGENLMKKFMGEVERPYSPPLGQRQTLEQNENNIKHVIGSPQKEEVELIYDPVLNCYYDHKTHTYYQLKN